MAAEAPTIVATSGGIRPGTRTRVEFDALVHHAVELAGETGRAPRVCHLGTAMGDQRSWNADLDEAARVAGFDLTHLNLFPMPTYPDVREHLLGQDVVWVGGGSVANLLAVWRVHGLDEVFREVWEAGVVLGGVSAGSLCWHVGGTTVSGSSTAAPSSPRRSASGTARAPTWSTPISAPSRRHRSTRVGSDPRSSVIPQGDTPGVSPWGLTLDLRGGGRGGRATTRAARCRSRAPAPAASGRRGCPAAPRTTR